MGGGVSQFATTMFNAAFFAGLDITDYAMHGLDISRYPYGREATLSFPSPDLKVRNQTPYGVLTWTKLHGIVDNGQLLLDCLRALGAVGTDHRGAAGRAAPGFHHDHYPHDRWPRHADHHH